MKFIAPSLFLFALLIVCKSNAQTWSAMDTGIATNPMDTEFILEPIGVFALQEYNNTLYAAGNFIKAGSVGSLNIAQWNGTLWDSVAEGNTEMIFALQVYNGNLISGGAFCYYLSQWNGTSWSQLGIGTNFFTKPGNGPPGIWGLTIYNGNLVASGRMDSVPGIHANNIAYWNGTNWNTFGSGLTEPTKNGNSGTVVALAIYNGNLIAGGGFDTAGGKPASNIAEWNGTAWLPLGSGINGFVYALAVYNGNLYAGGTFDSAGGNPATNIAMWNGSAWSPVAGVMSISSSVSALISYNGLLYAGGGFDTIGGIAANSIAYWNGTIWHAIGKGITGWGVDALLGNNTILYAGGIFDTTGNVPALNIAMCTNPTAIQEISNSSGFNIFPNPSPGLFTIQSSVNSGQWSVEIYNVLGEKVTVATLKQVQGDNRIDLASQPNGIYFYRVISEEGNLIGEGKVIIEK